MKCSKCGRDFGAGTHWQHCGMNALSQYANSNGGG